MAVSDQDAADLARLREEKQKKQFFAWLDEWWTAKTEEANSDKRTRTDSKSSGSGFLGGLFG